MYSTIKKWVKENRETAILIGAIIVAFFVYSSFYSSFPSLKFNSPDETANYFFAKMYAQDGVLRIFEPLNFIAGNRIQPRSMAVVNGYLVPGSFLGLILTYGWLAKIFGLKLLLCLTPVFAGFAVFCFYEIIKKIFSSKIAFWSALLLLIHPAFWYYSARGLFPNVLFVSFLIFSFYFLVQAGSSSPSASKILGKAKEKNYMDFILAGLFFGLAMIVRLSEIIWVGAVILALFFVYRKKVQWVQVGIFIIFAIITFSPIFAYNQIFYGSSLMTAYNLNDGGAAGGSGQGIGWLVSFTRYVFPFGLHFKNILKNFSNYFIGMFWWLAIPLAVGLSVFVRDFIGGKLEKKNKIYLIFFGTVSLFLFVYYGSWLIYDNPAKEVSVGTSYVRYWLPIYILSLPLVSWSLIKFVGFWRGWQKNIVAAAFCLSFFSLSVGLVFFDKNDGLVMVGANMREYSRIAEEVNRTIEPEAIIVVDRADKIFFPEHQVVQPLRDDQVYKLIPKLSEEVPLYYYGVTLPEKDIRYLYEKKFDPAKIEIVKIRDFGVESLYKFVEVK